MKNMKETRKRIPLIVLIAVVCLVGLAVTATTSGSAFADIFSPNNSNREINTSASATVESQEKTENENEDNATTYIGTEQAKTIVLAKVPGATITKIYFEYDEGRAEYDGEGYLGNEVYDFTVDAISGEIVEWEVDVKNTVKAASIDATSSATKAVDKSTATVLSDGTAVYIGLDAAKKIALERVPGATITEIYLEHDDGRVEYDGEMYLNNTQYEFTIDATTGTILEWETDDEIDDDDDDDDDEMDDDDDEMDDDDDEMDD